MNAKAKSIFVLVGVLLIGVIIGAFGSSLLRKNFIEERISRFRTPEGFTGRIIDIIQPEEEQRKKVEAILLKHHQMMLEIGEQTREEIKTHVDSLMNELKPLLSAEQLERLEKKIRRRPPHFHDRKDKRIIRHRE